MESESDTEFSRTRPFPLRSFEGCSPRPKLSRSGPEFESDRCTLPIDSLQRLENDCQSESTARLYQPRDTRDVRWIFRCTAPCETWHSRELRPDLSLLLPFQPTRNDSRGPGKEGGKGVPDDRFRGIFLFPSAPILNLFRIFGLLDGINNNEIQEFPLSKTQPISFYAGDSLPMAAVLN